MLKGSHCQHKLHILFLIQMHLSVAHLLPNLLHRSKWEVQWEPIKLPVCLDLVEYSILHLVDIVYHLRPSALLRLTVEFGVDT